MSEPQIRPEGFLHDTDPQLLQAAVAANHREFFVKDRIVQLLKERPELANRRFGEMQTTPLHVAVERNDRALAQVLLNAHADLSIKDAMFGATPLDWAKHFQHTDMIELIQRRQANQPKT